MKELILNNWNAWRIIRMVLSIVFIVAGFMNLDYFLVAGGGFIFFQALFNTGCCAAGNCSDGSCEVKYEKVKSK